MQKKERAKTIFYLFIISAIIMVLLTSSCTYVNKVKQWHETPAIMEVPREAVRQIDVIELKEAEEEVPAEEIKAEPELPEVMLSIEECRALTLENNLDLHVQLINPAINGESVKQEEAKYEATFSGTANYKKSETPTATLLEGASGTSSSQTGYVNLGVDLPLRTGGTLSFDFLDYRNKTNSTWSTLNPSYTTDFTASISQPLLKNAGRRASTYSIRAAQYSSKLMDVQTKLQAINIIGNVDIAYWQLYAYRRLLDVRKQQYDLSKALFEQTERFVEVGSKPRIELIRTKSNMVSSAEQIIQAENSVREKERSLKRMLKKKGLGMETKTIIIPSTLPDPVHYEFDQEKMVKNAIENRMEMLELELRLASDDNYIEYLKNQALPQATFDYKYNINGLGPQRGDAYEMMKDNDFNDHTFNLTFSIPLGNRVAKSRIRKAMYERAQRLVTKENKEDEIRNDVLNRIDKIEADWQRILASRQSTILSDEQYKAEKKQFELGLVTSTDVLDAQTKLADAQRLEIVAITDYQISLINLAYSTGTLLGAAKVELEYVDPLY